MRSLFLVFPLALAACPAPTDDKADTDSDTVESDAPDTDTTVDTDVEHTNQAPGAPEVALGPAHPTTATGLTATLTTESTDPDGDEVTYTWTWRADGIVRGDVSGPTVAPGVARKGETWEVEVSASDGLRSSEPATASVTLENAEPTLELSWYDDTPSTDDDLHVRATIVDADHEPLTTTYVWTKDGDATGYGTAVVPAYHTSVGEQWEVTVSVVDGSGAGVTDSLSVTVVDRDPVISAVTITPDPASPGAALTASASASDADHDTLTTTWTWKRNGTTTGYTTASLPPGATTLGDTWTATARVTDGRGGAATLSADVDIVDQPPVATVDISPADPFPGEALTASVDALDPEGDTLAITYAWTVDGVPAVGRTSATIPAGITHDNEVWAVTATVNDGHNPHVDATASVEVIDEPPIIWSGSISPARPDDADDLAIVDLFASDPDGNPVTFTYVWTLDYVVVPDLVGTTVPAARTHVGDTWQVQITAFDGRKQSAVYAPPAVRIR